MKLTFPTISGSVTAPRGFRAAGVGCDIKELGTGKGSEKGRKRDLAVIASDTAAAVAGMFTTNQVCAAPVLVSRARAARARAQAIVANSGNANACTGARGWRDAESMTRMVAARLGIPDRRVLVCSTGRIGLRLPMARVEAGIEAACGCLEAGPEGARNAAEAILTSDTRCKEYAVEFRLHRLTVRLGGIAKGAGMIEPALSPSGRRPASQPMHATMLAMLTTDAAVRPAVLKRALREAVAQSFNRITIDGDMSTNDAVILLANGKAGNPEIERLESSSGKTFQAALNQVTLELAKMMVRDGEGVSRVVTLRIHGARTFADADAAARAVGNSQLVKTSWCGGDPNWGRIMDALGYSAARVEPDKVDIAYARSGERRLLYAARKGCATGTSLEDLAEITRLPEFDLHIHLHLGMCQATLYASDLTEAYVDYNKGE